MGKSTFQIPEGDNSVSQINDLDVSVVEDLAGAEQVVVDAAEALADVDDPTDEQLERLDALVALVERIRQEGATRADAVQQRRDRAAAAKERLAGPAAEDEQEEPGDGDSEDTADEGTADEGTADEGTEAPAEEEAPAEQEAVAAAARGRKAPSLLRHRGTARPPASPRPERREKADKPRVTITASSGIRGVEAGSELNDFDALVDAFMARATSHPSGYVPDQYQRHAVASFSRGVQAFDGLVDTNPEYRDDPLALFDAAADEKRLSSSQGQGSLAAAGGWCAPSETLYDLVSLESTDGLFDLPEVAVKRGGINLTTGPDFSAIYAGVGFAQTEAQAIAGTTKTCYEVDCPDFAETRLDAVGLCVKSPLLTNAAYPELVRRVLAGSLVAHEHKKAIRALNSVSTALGTAVTVPAAGSVARSTLTGLELASEGQRAAFRMQRNQTMEVTLPNYVRVVLRDDLQSRLRSVEPVTDAQLDAHFAARKLRVQFVYGFGDTRIVTVPGGGTLLTDFPDTFPALLYPAGTFVKGVADVINLDTVYDSTDLESNIYTASFIEEGMLVARRAPGGGKLTLNVVSKGSVGPADLAAYGITDA